MILRVWGIHRAIGVSVALCVGTAILATSVVSLPTFEQVVVVANLVPPLAGLLLGHTLVEPMPEAAKVAQRRLPAIYAARYVAIQLVSAGVAVAMAVAVDVTLYAVAPAFVGLSALCVTALRDWYWVPLVPVMYGWLQLSQSAHYLEFVDSGAIWLIGFTVASGAAYSVIAPRWVTV